MVIVYVVTSGEYSDYGIEGIFSTEKKAKTFKCKKDESNIEEWELDKRATDVILPYWISTLDIATGDLKPGNSGELLAHPNARVDAVKHLDYSSISNPRGCIIAKSFVSQEHANKLCIEKRQEIQRQGE